MKDLWPDIIEEPTVNAPVLILKEQGAFLGRRTGNLIVANVHRIDMPEFITFTDFPFIYRFDLVAPTLGDYSYRLFEIGHEIDPYPVVIGCGQDLMEEITDRNGSTTKACTEEEFFEVLRKIFAAKRTRQVINGLIVQIRGVEKASELQSGAAV